MTNNPSKNYLERFLSLFTQVRAGEGATALLMVFNIFLILTSYYIIKPVREALILAAGTEQLSGAVLKSLAATGQVVLLMIAIPLYSRLASRVPRRKLINLVTIIFAGCLVVFYLLSFTTIPMGFIFFLWVGIFNLMVPAQFWAFANDLYTPEAGKRIFVLIAFGASAGAVLGGVITDFLIEIVGVYQLLIIAGIILLLSLILTNIADSRDTAETSESGIKSGSQKEPEKLLDKKGAFSLVFRKKYLLMIALMMFLLNWVNTNGEFILGQTVENAAKNEVKNQVVAQQAEEYAARKWQNTEKSYEEIPNQDDKSEENVLNSFKEEYFQQYIEEYIGNFYAGFFTVVNLIGLLLQLFLVSRILKYLGIRIAILILPFISLTGYFFIAFFPILTIIRWVKIAENSTDYSLQNTVRQVLFLPTTREEKYKAKQAIDTFFWRAGDVLSTVVVYTGTTWLMLKVNQFALINIVLVIIWLVLSYFIGKENARMTAISENGSND
jgi:AAA family ATP:ADP antiporter